MGEPSRTITDAVKRWVLAQKQLERAKSQLNSAECELTNATTALGNVAAPGDAVDGEQFNFWIRGDEVGLTFGGDVERLLNVKVDGPSHNRQYKIQWRKRDAKK